MIETKELSKTCRNLGDNFSCHILQRICTAHVISWTKFSLCTSLFAILCFFSTVCQKDRSTVIK